MVCFMCKGKLERKNISYMAEIDNTIIIIKEVPANVCKQCGEKYIDDDVMVNIEKIVKNLKKESKEISIIKYTDKTA